MSEIKIDAKKGYKNKIKLEGDPNEANTERFFEIWFK